MTAVAALVAALAALAAPSGELAFRLALRGDLVEATAEAERVLAVRPRDPIALLVLGCVAVERGDLARAEAFAGRLEEVGSPRGPVLRRLAERRRAQPAERMQVALAEAWKAAGKPETGRDVDFDAWDWMGLLPPLRPAALAKLSEAERVALEASWWWSLEDDEGEPRRRARPDRVLAAAKTPGRNPFWVNVLLLRLVAPWADDAAEPRRRAVDAARRLAAALAAADPGNGYYGMAAVAAEDVPRAAYDAWTGNPADYGKGGAPPLADRELAALEAAAAAPRFAWPARRLQVDARERLRAVDPAHGDVRAAILSAYPLYNLPLQLRAEATAAADVEMGRRAARALAGLGRRLRASAVGMDRLVSFMLEGTAARIAGDAAAEAELQRSYEATRDFADAVSAAYERLGAWPLVSVLRELDPEQQRSDDLRLLE